MSAESMNLRSRIRGALLGLAAGDAVGTTLEFRPPGTFDPISDMVGGGPFGLKPGEWTDDTSMALCLAESLVERGGFDEQDQMERYVRWWKDGHLSSRSECFDIGTTVRAALARYLGTGEAFAGTTDSNASGNGSLMRLAPAVLAYASAPEKAVAMAGESSRTTHASPQCVDACRLFARYLLRALSGAPKESIVASAGLVDAASPPHRAVIAIAGGSFLGAIPLTSAEQATSWPLWKPRCGRSTEAAIFERRSCWRRISGTTPTRRPQSRVRSPEHSGGRKEFLWSGARSSRCGRRSKRWRTGCTRCRESKQGLTSRHQERRRLKTGARFSAFRAWRCSSQRAATANSQCQACDAEAMSSERIPGSLASRRRICSPSHRNRH